MSLSESIHYNERIQVDQLKREKLPILREYQEETIDLSCSKKLEFFRRKNVNLSGKIIRNLNLLENALNVYFYLEYKHMERNFYKKWA